MQNDEDQEQEADTGYNWIGLNLQLVPSNECLSFKRPIQVCLTKMNDNILSKEHFKSQSGNFIFDLSS